MVQGLCQLFSNLIIVQSEVVSTPLNSHLCMIFSAAELGLGIGLQCVQSVIYSCILCMHCRPMLLRNKINVDFLLNLIWLNLCPFTFY